MSDSSVERRFSRYVIQLPLLHKAKGPAPNRVGVGWSRNLSEGGACAELAETLPPQMPLQVRLQTDHGAIEVEGEVLWADTPTPSWGGILHGLAFTQVAPDQRQALRDLIRSKGWVQHGGVRLPLDIPVTCQLKGQPGPALEGRTENVSRGGLLLDLPQRLPRGTLLALTLHTSAGLLPAEGMVVWGKPPAEQTPGGPIRHGIQFTAMTWPTALSLGRLLAEPFSGSRSPARVG